MGGCDNLKHEGHNRSLLLLLENADFYAKNQKRFEGSGATFIFRLRKNGRKKACPSDGNSPERGLSL